MAEGSIYRVVFFNQGEVWEVYARSVGQSGLLGFIEVGELLFGQGSQVVVDPPEERLKSAFKNVTASASPSTCHPSRRGRQGGPSRVAATADAKAQLMPFPTPAFTKSAF
ncbi:MAG: DUF1820 family protein [Thermoanaerobaculia bacterium]